MLTKPTAAPASALRLISLLALTICCLALPGCSRAGGLDGLYLRNQFAFGHIEFNTFYIQGDLIVWSPKGGIDPFDLAAAEKAEPKNVGHFKMNGDHMDVTWGGGRGEAHPRVEMKNGVISGFDGGIVTKAKSFGGNGRMDATFGGVMLAGGAHGITGGRTMAFQKDGHFSLSTLATAELNPNVIGGKGSVSADSNGTYTLTGNTLTLNFADGKTEKHTVVPVNTNLDPAQAKVTDETMFLDSLQLTRSK